MKCKQNEAVVTFGDSITVMPWPDFLVDRLAGENIRNLSILIGAISGNRILHNSSNLSKRK